MDAWPLDTRLVLDTEKACSTPSSRCRWMAGMTLGLASSRNSDHGVECWGRRWRSLEPRSLWKQPGRPFSGDLGNHLSIDQAAVSTKHGCLRQASGLTGAFSPSGKPYSGEWTAKWSYLYALATNIPNSGFFTFIPKPAAQNYQRWQVGALRVLDSKHYAGQKYGRAEDGRRPAAHRA